MSTVIKVDKDYDVLNSAAESLREGSLVAFLLRPFTVLAQMH